MCVIHPTYIEHFPEISKLVPPLKCPLLPLQFLTHQRFSTAPARPVVHQLTPAQLGGTCDWEKKRRIQKIYKSIMFQRFNII